MLMPPPGGEIPDFEQGWVGEADARTAFLAYVEESGQVNWSEDLEALHEESSRDHFIDVWTRRAMLAHLGPLPAAPVIADVGCSTGHLLEDLHRAHPDGTLVGVDLVASGLRKAHMAVPGALLLLADACELPLQEASVDAVVSANLLEHVPDDELALSEVARVLRPGAPAVFVVPTGPGTYDYYDRFLGHERRYRRGELAEKARCAGLEVIRDIHIGSILYPAFWLVKKAHRARYGKLDGQALQDRVARDIAGTRDSRAGRLSCRLEEAMLARGISLPFGIRGLTLVRRPGGTR